MPARVLFLCTGSSCRSQMAEGLLRAIGRGAFEPFSAGIEAHGLNPLVVELMKEIGIDISHQQSKTLARYRDDVFDHVFMVCDHARETCPVLPSAQQYHWNFEDPALFVGFHMERMLVFRRVRDEMGVQLRQFLGCLDRLTRKLSALP